MAVAVCPYLASFYALLSIVLVTIVASNLIMLAAYRPPMSGKEWAYVVIVLILIMLNALVLLLAPSTRLAPYLVPFWGDIKL